MLKRCRSKSACARRACFRTATESAGESARSDADLSASGRQIPALQIESALLYHRKHGGRLGLFLAVGLETLADALVATKALLRGRVPVALAQGRHLRTLWSLLLRTRAASRPTR